MIAFRQSNATRRVHPFAPLAFDPAQAVYAGWMLGAPVSTSQARAQWASLRSLPVFVYPLRTLYKGLGDPAHWMNYYAPADYSLLFDPPAGARP